MKAVIAFVTGVTLACTLLIAGPAAVAHSTSDRGHAVYYGPKWFDHTIHSTTSARRYLHGATPGFKRYAAEQGALLRQAAIKAGASHACVKRTGVQVQRFHTRGFAYGAIGGCGGAVALWKRVGGHWRHIIITQDVIYCSRLHRFEVPASVVRSGKHPATCYSRAQDTVVRYHHR